MLMSKLIIRVATNREIFFMNHPAFLTEENFGGKTDMLDGFSRQRAKLTGVLKEYKKYDRPERQFKD